MCNLVGCATSSCNITARGSVIWYSINSDNRILKVNEIVDQVSLVKQIYFI